jgi:hypothetical protein
MIIEWHDLETQKRVGCSKDTGYTGIAVGQKVRFAEGTYYIELKIVATDKIVFMMHQTEDTQ